MENFDELYYRKPAVREFDAVVTACTEGKKEWRVELNQTAFYPEGGGQPGDSGLLIFSVGGGEKRIRVHGTRRDGDHILHFTDGPIAVGTAVHGVMDWQRRTDFTQNHTGEHILSGLIHRHYGYDNVGFHMNDSLVTIDVGGVLTWEQLMELEREANAVIESDLPVEELYPEQDELARMEYRSKKAIDGQVRIIRIPGADTCACCGTHVGRTGEIGLLKCLSMIHYKEGVRVELVCGRLALLDYERKVDQNTEISHMLSAKPVETALAVRRLQEEMEQLRARNTALTGLYIDSRIAELPDSEDLLIFFEEQLGPDDRRRLCDCLLKEGRARTCAVLGRRDPQDAGAGYQYVIGSREKDLVPIIRDLNQRLQGRGGGKSGMVQGFFGAGREQIEETLRTVLTN